MNNTLSNKEIAAVHEILVGVLALSQSQITPDARIVADLGADSLHMIEIATALEEQFQVSIPDEDWDRISTVSDLYESLARILDQSERARL